MRRSKHQRLLRTIAVIAVMVGVLLFLLPHSSAHHGIATACIVLVPEFLFGTVDVPRTLWTIVQSGEALSVLTLSRPALFQRPPPLAFL
jgi:hypothetical protein